MMYTSWRYLHNGYHYLCKTWPRWSHIKTHSRERPYNCNRCDKRFKTVFLKEPIDSIYRCPPVYLWSLRIQGKPSHSSTESHTKRSWKPLALLSSMWIQGKPTISSKTSHTGLLWSMWIQGKSKSQSEGAHQEKTRTQRNRFFLWKVWTKGKFKICIWDHKAYKHDGQTFRCEECDYKSTT